MKYTDDFWPKRGDRVVFGESWQGHRGRVISADHEAKEVYVRAFNDYGRIYRKKYDDVQFIKPCPWWAFWQK